MRLVTNDEMKKIDTWSIKTLGIPGTVLMENAGIGCVNILEDYFDLENLKVLIICGKGNNGGDGFVIGRHLQNRGSLVKIILVGKKTELKGDARINYMLARKAKIDITETATINTAKNIYATFHPDVIVDALFGTGFQGAPTGIYYKLIELINNTDAFVFSVDIPSGINGNSGQFEDTCVIADATATMCLPKRGNYLYPGREFCGDLFVVDIGVPYNLIYEGYPRLTEFDDINRLLPFRPPDGHKGTFGNVLIIAGARGFSGAAAMAAIATLKVGAGLVRLAAPRSIMNSLEAKLLEVVKVALPETNDETISPTALDIVLPYVTKSDVVIIGPGITTHPETARFLFSFLPRVKVPLIVDADAINIIAQDVSYLKKIRAPFILTPHPGELSRLIKTTPAAINAERIDLASQLARDFGGVLVLKGAPTVIASPHGETFVNPTGNSGLASAGSGDVLVGMIGGFLAQKVSPLNAAVLGVFLHALCADCAMDENNEYSLTAGDLIDYIPQAMNYVLRREFINDKRND
jgi:NAD(P)H-hydrate epimerase